MQQKVTGIGPIKPKFRRKAPDILDPMQAFIQAMDHAHKSVVDLATPIPMLGDVRPSSLPSKLTSYFVLSLNKPIEDLHTLKMTLRYDKSALFGTITALVSVKGNSIELSNATYDSKARGCSAYAIRHFLSAFDGLKNLSFSTNEIFAQEVAAPFARMGFEIFDRSTKRRIDLEALEKGRPLENTIARLDFKKAPIRRLVFGRLGIAMPTRPNQSTARSEPERNQAPVPTV